MRNGNAAVSVSTSRFPLNADPGKHRHWPPFVRRRNIICALAAGLSIGSMLAPLSAPAALTTPAPFVAFESGQVRPLALLPGSKRLVAVNTPDNRLELFDVDDKRLKHVGSIPVGMEPVAVAARSDNEVWVVNHLSDSVSVVDLDANPPRVTRTLLVGDEPRDIVFAGPGGTRAFITAAHRGQNVPFDPQPFTPGVGRADVWVFNANKDSDERGAEYRGGTSADKPLTIISLFTDTPRALAVSNDGNTVYAAGFHTGNQTTVIGENAVCDGGVTAPPCKPSENIFGLPPVEYEATAPGGLPAPTENVDGIPAPEVGLIVKYNGTHWVDELGRSWDSMVRFNLPDKDVFAIDAKADIPRVVRSVAGVGTVLFNMTVNPRTGKLYVSNTEAVNDVRFEGSRPEGSTISTVQGKLHLSQITVLDGDSKAVRHLNKHIDYNVRPAPSGVKEKSLSIPTAMAVTRDGRTLYLAAFGSSKVGVFDTKSLENDSFQPDASDHIVVSGGGPSAVTLNEEDKVLYVLTRFDNSISVIDTRAKREIGHYAMPNPEPESLVRGRPFLYDATYTSSNGEASCASCHVFGDFDSLAWDLGDPTGSVLNHPGPFIPDDTGPLEPLLHPMKGPMTTQSLRGLANQGPMHWRGDRTGGNDAASVPPDSGSYDEDAAFKKFNVAFAGLMGRNGPLTDEEMQSFTDFMLQVTYPPNPYRALDNSLTAQEKAGQDFFRKSPSLVFNGLTCEACHREDPSQGFFGSGGESAFNGQTQLFKNVHLRNQYQKIGMFGMPVLPSLRAPGVDEDPMNEHMGDQVRGVGFLHDGSVDTMFRFNRGPFFAFKDDEQRRAVEAYQLVIDTDLAPIVGQQVTLSRHSAKTAGARIDLLLQRAQAGECDVIVKGNTGNRSHGWAYTGTDFKMDVAESEPVSDSQLRRLGGRPGHHLTYTCVPPGSGIRMGIDRDLDGILDGDDA